MTQQAWTNDNLKFKDWYFENYPFLKQFQFPISHDFLQMFYETDIVNRNFNINSSIHSEYELTFSYFLDNFPKNDKDKFSGKTPLGYVIDAIPKAVNDTIIKPIEGGFNISLDFLKNLNKYFPLIIGVAGLFFATKLFK